MVIKSYQVAWIWLISVLLLKVLSKASQQYSHGLLVEIDPKELEVLIHTNEMLQDLFIENFEDAILNSFNSHPAFSFYSSFLSFNFALSDVSLDMDDSDFKDFKFGIAEDLTHLETRTPTLNNFTASGTISIEIATLFTYNAKFHLSLTDIFLLLDYYLDVNEYEETQVVLHTAQLGFDQYGIECEGDKQKLDRFISHWGKYLLGKLNKLLNEFIFVDEWMNGPIVWTLPKSMLQQKIPFESFSLGIDLNLAEPMKISNNKIILNVDHSPNEAPGSNNPPSLHKGQVLAIKPQNHFIDGLVSQLKEQNMMTFTFASNEPIYLGQNNLGKMFFTSEYLYDVAPWFIDQYPRQELKFNFNLTDFGYNQDKHTHLSLGIKMEIFVKQFGNINFEKVEEVDIVAAVAFNFGVKAQRLLLNETFFNLHKYEIGYSELEVEEDAKFTMDKLNKTIALNFEFIERYLSRSTWTLERLLFVKLDDFVQHFEWSEGTFKILTKAEEKLQILDDDKQRRYEVSLRKDPIQIPDLETPSITHQIKEQLIKILYALDNLHRKQALKPDLGYYSLCSWNTFSIIITLERIQRFIFNYADPSDPFLSFILDYIDTMHVWTELILDSDSFENKIAWVWTKLSGSDDIGWASLSLLELIEVYPQQQAKYLNYEGQDFQYGLLKALDKIEKAFTDENGFVYWGRMPLGNEYFATVSFATYILSLLKVYDLTGDANSLEKARKNFQQIQDPDLLWDDSGLLRDGYQKFTNWNTHDVNYLTSNSIKSYYQPMIALIYLKFYELDGDESLLSASTTLIKNCINLIPNPEGYINGKFESGFQITDIEAFKGIFIRYLGEFAIAAQGYDLRLSHQIKELIDHNQFNMWLTRSSDYDLPRNWSFEEQIKPEESDSVIQASGIDLLVANLYTSNLIEE